MNGLRLQRRLWRHHLPLAVVAGGIGAGAAALSHPPNARFGWSMASAYAGLALMAVTLLLGPIRVLRGRPTAVSFDLRRDAGIWAGCLALLHVVLGLQAHMGGRIWLYFVPEGFPNPPLRFDLFGGANDAGLAAAVIVLVLLALSNDLSLRHLGGRWKPIQRWNYYAFGLAVLHTAGYQLIDKQKAVFVAGLAGGAILVAALQVAGARRRRQRQRDRLSG